MELSELKSRIISSFSGSEKDLMGVLQMIEDDRAVYPFNEYEHLIISLLEKNDCRL